MIRGEQIRIARAILDWSTADLAAVSGLTVNGLNKIERGLVVPQQDSLRKVQRVFEAAGLEFLPNLGVRKRDRITLVWEGPGSCAQLLDDIYQDLRDIGGEVLISGVGEERSIAAVGREKMDEYLSRLARSGITERLLCCEGDKTFLAPIADYHWVPKKYFSPDSFLLYGSKIALVIWTAPEKVVVIDDALMVEGIRKLFNFVWDHTQPPRK